MEKLTKRYIYSVILITMVIVVMYVVGMSDIHFSPPFDVGFNQFIDIYAGILFACWLLIGFIIYLIFKKK